MNDDKHNDVWVSCFHGNSKGLGMVSHRVLFLMTVTDNSNTKSLGQETFFYKLCLQWSMQ